MVASIDKIGRREFLRAGLVFGAGAAGLAAGYAAVPDVFARAMYAAKQEKVTNDKVLVMIQLAGGNDGLQTVIPLHDQVYRDLRPQLGKAADEALAISSDFGLNKNLKGVKKLPSAANAHQTHLDGVLSPQTLKLLNEASDDKKRWSVVFASPEFQLK